ncbi:hypothetical protein [Parasediminibacterium sp. JCM 36343]|uniref:hypothetical protein n=1 Tax=Parasediminibacterium sp. JCM 36343 TaxID=3374279 RepID=UPI00397B4529
MSRIFGRKHSVLWQGQKIKQMLVFEVVESCNRFQLQNLGSSDVVKKNPKNKCFNKVFCGVHLKMSFFLFPIWQKQAIFNLICIRKPLVFAVQQTTYMGEVLDTHGRIFPPYRIFILGFIHIHANFALNLG